ncbi:hypothetical protein FOL46_007335 [Perkinsus olseni]|uniref:Heparan-alpha-glucosaminide N-acetyltransferase catalytic domain-containing protein n=1 Tax=Perkinsus olseni TaxID=32597 RepID=A0A7J6LEI0_PEROL|nr:hypothetical protein FOL46_007335 [Perkinsus olseni]
MLCVGISLAIVHEDKVKWRNVIIRTLKLGAAAGALSAITYTFMPRSPIYFGAIHCITLNTLLTMFFIRVPRVALLGFIFTQLYTIMVGRFPLEVPTNRPTVDVIPWFHNLGYCLLGLWLHSVGAHKIAVVELIPGKPIHLEDTVFTFFGRHATIHENGINYRSVGRRAVKLGIVAASITLITYVLNREEFIYFGAIHCILVNSLLTVPFTRIPRAALVGFLLIQGYTMKWGTAPVEVPQDIPTLDVIPWFHNFGYCLLGVWLHSRGLHKLESITIIPGRPAALEGTVFTTFGRHCLAIYLGHMLIVLPVVWVVSTGA